MIISIDELFENTGDYVNKDLIVSIGVFYILCADHDKVFLTKSREYLYNDAYIECSLDVITTNFEFNLFTFSWGCDGTSYETYFESSIFTCTVESNNGRFAIKPNEIRGVLKHYSRYSIYSKDLYPSFDNLQSIEWDELLNNFNKYKGEIISVKFGIEYNIDKVAVTFMPLNANDDIRFELINPMRIHDTLDQHAFEIQHMNIRANVKLILNEIPRNNILDQKNIIEMQTYFENIVGVHLIEQNRKYWERWGNRSIFQRLFGGPISFL